jgi:hypothetical protein
MASPLPRDLSVDAFLYQMLLATEVKAFDGSVPKVVTAPTHTAAISPYFNIVTPRRSWLFSSRCSGSFPLRRFGSS